MSIKNWTLIFWMVFLTTTVFASDNATLIADFTNSSVIFDRTPFFDYIQIDNSSIVFKNLSYSASTFSYVIPDLNQSFPNQTMLITRLINMSSPNTASKHIILGYNQSRTNVTLTFDVDSCGTLLRIEYASSTGLFRRNYTSFSCSGGTATLLIPGIEFSNQFNILNLTWLSVVSPASTGGGRSRRSVEESAIGNIELIGSEGILGIAEILQAQPESISSVKQTLFAQRGSPKETHLFLTNTYGDAVIENVHFEVEGVLSRYVKITPIIDTKGLVFVEGGSNTLSRIGQTIPFSFENIGEHTITADRIGTDSVVITVKSEPVSVNLSVGEIKSIDIDNDGTADIAIPLRSIDNKIASLGVYRLGPSSPEKIYFLENKRYDFAIFAPMYLETRAINLTVTIIADIVATDPIKAGFNKKKFFETRTVTFRVFGVSQIEVLDSIKNAKNSISRADDAKFTINYLNELLAQAEELAKDQKYEESFKIANEIISQVDAVFKVNDLMKEIENSIIEAKGKLLKTAETEKAFELVKKAFEREDYISALNRAKETQLTLFLETRGRVNILWFIEEYWPLLMFGSIFVYLLLIYAYGRIMIAYLGLRLAELEKEEHIVINSMKTEQKLFLEKGKLSNEDYVKNMARNENRLNEIMKQKIELRNKRLFLMQTREALANVKKEEEELTDVLKESQTKFLVKGELTKERFEQIYKAEQKRIAELEHEETKFKGGIGSKIEKYIETKVVPNIWERLNRLKPVKNKRQKSKKRKK